MARLGLPIVSTALIASETGEDVGFSALKEVAIADELEELRRFKAEAEAKEAAKTKSSRGKKTPTETEVELPSLEVDNTVSE